MKTLKLLITLFIFFHINLYAEEYQTEEETQGYTLGEGIKLGNLPLYIGGYLSADYRNIDNENRYRMDDIALLVYGNYNKLSYMSEFEFKNFYSITKQSQNSTIDKDTSLHIERLYADYTFNENYMLRGGKYNSPIGYWNMLPINVLRDTSSSPISTEIIFPKYTTGGLFSYTSYTGGEFQIDLLLQHNNDLDASYNNYEVDSHYGLGVTYSYNELSLKLNLGSFNSLNKDDSSTMLYYALVSFEYETEKYKIMGELGTQHDKDDFTTKYAGYIQGAYYITPKHAAILRAESFELNTSRNEAKQKELGIIGYTYRPLYPLAFKTEYQFDSSHIDNQFLISISVLF